LNLQSIRSKSYKFIILCSIITINVLSVYQFSSAESYISEEPQILFITENPADFELASFISQNFNGSTTTVDIKTSDDLNQLCLVGDFFNSYNSVIMILNQISIPFNDTLVSILQNFLENGGMYGIISTQIWRFPSTFHSLIGLEFNQQGQKEWPVGNNSEAIQLSITNDTYLQSPFSFPQNSSLEIQGAIGVAQPANPSYSTAISHNTPNGNTSINILKQKNGFLIAAPISPIEVSPSLTNLSHFFTSAVHSGLFSIQQPQSNSSATITPLINDLLHFSLSAKAIEFGVVLSSVSTVLIGLAFVISRIINKSNVKLDLPKDKSLFTTFIIGPIIFLGQILYPPILRRIDEYDVIENEFRRQILELLEDKDFSHFRELKRELSIGTSSLRWHLQVLEDFRIITRQVYGQYEIYHLLQKEPAQDFLELYFAILSGGGYHTAQAFSINSTWDLDSLSKYLLQSKESIRYHLKKMTQIKLIQVNNHRYTLNSQKKQLLLDVLERRRKNN
jgi:predicted transcriptional regulator